MNYDVVIIGSGLAGLNSALQASKYGKVLVVTKSRILESNSHYAQGGIAGVFDHGDNFKKHIEDTLTAGARHNDKKAVKYFVEQAPKIIKMLQNLGIHFQKNAKGRYALHNEGGHQFSRIVHVGDHTGKSIMDVLAKKVRSHKNITVWENSFALDLIVKNKTCYGVKVIRQKKGLAVYARRVILASGGCGQLYEYTTNPKVTTGDGIALAARAGCRLKDMEFIQFHPTAFAKGQSPLFLLSETLRGEGAKMLNSKGERFMLKYHPQAELAPRDIVSRAIFEEQKHGQVFLDLRQKKSSGNSGKLHKMFPTIYAYLRKKGYDLNKDLVPIIPAAHYLCGGVKTDVFGQTNINNLYAVGEVACTGLHGANRLASNSLLEAAIMSEHVMKSPLPIGSSLRADADLRKIGKKFPKISLPSIQFTPGSKKVSTSRSKLQELMWKCAGIVRTKKLLRQAENQIKSTKKQVSKYPESIKKLELENMLQVSEIVIKAALKRKKSLGAHFRKN